LLHSAGVSSIYRGAERMSGSDWQHSIDWWSPRIPFGNLEAVQTNRAIVALPAHLRRVVKRVYVLAPWHCHADHARALKIGRTTLWRWLCQIDAALEHWLSDHQTRVQTIDFVKHQAYKPVNLGVTATKRPTGNSASGVFAF